MEVLIMPTLANKRRLKSLKKKHAFKIFNIDPSVSTYALSKRFRVPERDIRMWRKEWEKEYVKN
jgi:hypothetical protein